MASKIVLVEDDATIASVAALSISIILFISLSGLLNVAKGLEYMVHSFEAGDVVVDYVSDWERRENPVTGRREVYYYYTIDNNTAEEVTKKLSEYDGSDVFGQGYELDWYYTKLSKDNVAAQMLAALEYEADMEQPVYDVNATMIMIDQKHYEEICKQAGVEPGATILINYYQYNHKGTLEGVVPFPEGIDSITLEYASNVMEEFFPQGDLDYMEAGFTTRVFLGTDFMSVLNFGVGIVSFFLYSFVIILALIWGTIRFSAKQMEKQNIIETIRVQ